MTIHGLSKSWATPAWLAIVARSGATKRGGHPSLPSSRRGDVEATSGRRRLFLPPPRPGKKVAKEEEEEEEVEEDDGEYAVVVAGVPRPALAKSATSIIQSWVAMRGGDGMGVRMRSNECA